MQHTSCRSTITVKDIIISKTGGKSSGRSLQPLLCNPACNQNEVQKRQQLSHSCMWLSHQRRPRRVMETNFFISDAKSSGRINDRILPCVGIPVEKEDHCRQWPDAPSADDAQRRKPDAPFCERSRGGIKITRSR